MKAIAVTLGVVVLLAAVFVWRERPRESGADNPGPLAQETAPEAPSTPPIPLDQLRAAESTLPETSPEDPSWQPPDLSQSDDRANLETVLRMEAEEAVKSGQLPADQVERFISQRREEDQRLREDLAREAAEARDSGAEADPDDR